MNGGGITFDGLALGPHDEVVAITMFYDVLPLLGETIEMLIFFHLQNLPPAPPPSKPRSLAQMSDRLQNFDSVPAIFLGCGHLTAQENQCTKGSGDRDMFETGPVVSQKSATSKRTARRDHVVVRHDRAVFAFSFFPPPKERHAHHSSFSSGEHEQTISAHSFFQPRGGDIRGADVQERGGDARGADVSQSLVDVQILIPCPQFFWDVVI